MADTTRHPSPVTRHSPDVAIVGGGVIGCACAWMLARAGASVTLYERGRIGGEASGASAGILAPLAESPAPGAFARLAVAGLRTFAEESDALVEESGIDPEYRRRGVLRLALTPGDVEPLQAAAGWQANQALGVRWCPPDELRAMEPLLAPSAGGLLATDEAQVRPALLVRALAAAAARHGARLIEHAEVGGPVVEGDRVVGVAVSGSLVPAGAVLLTGGAWTGRLAAAAGVTLPVHPVKGQYLLLAPPVPPLRRVVFAGHGYLVPRLDGTVYTGATQEEAGFDRRPTAAGIAEVLALACAILPSLAEAEVVGFGAGLRPGIADGLPALGRVPNVDGLYVAGGHFRNGVLLSLITGRVMAALLTGEEPEIELGDFDPGRFGEAGTVLTPGPSPNAGRGEPTAAAAGRPERHGAPDMSKVSTPARGTPRPALGEGPRVRAFEVSDAH